MQLDLFLSETGNRIRKRLDFVADPPEWGLKAKQAAYSNSTFLDATIGTAQNESGFHYFPRLLRRLTFNSTLDPGRTDMCWGS